MQDAAKDGELSVLSDSHFGLEHTLLDKGYMAYKNQQHKQLPRLDQFSWDDPSNLEIFLI